MLKAAGYATAQAGKFAAGFERVGAAAFQHFRPFRDLAYFGAKFCTGWPAACKNLPPRKGLESQAVAGELADWIARAPRPFYAEADFYAAHDPWGSDPSDRSKFLATRFEEPPALYHEWGGAGAVARVRAAAAAARKQRVGLADYKLGPTPASRPRAGGRVPHAALSSARRRPGRAADGAASGLRRLFLTNAARVDAQVPVREMPGEPGGADAQRRQAQGARPAAVR